MTQPETSRWCGIVGLLRALAVLAVIVAAGLAVPIVLWVTG